MRSIRYALVLNRFFFGLMSRRSDRGYHWGGQCITEEGNASCNISWYESFKRVMQSIVRSNLAIKSCDQDLQSDPVTQMNPSSLLSTCLFCFFSQSFVLVGGSTFMSKLLWIRSQVDAHGPWNVYSIFGLKLSTRSWTIYKFERSTSSQRISCEVRFARMDVFAGCETHQPE